jgi:hypothetical protein
VGVTAVGEPLLTRYQEGRNLVEDLFNAELLLRREVLVHVCLDEQTEQVLVLALLERSSPTGCFLLEDCLLLLTHELETDSSHGLLGLGDRLGLLIRHLIRMGNECDRVESSKERRTIQLEDWDSSLEEADRGSHSSRC